MGGGGGKVVVIGSGVIGTACAYYLSRAGWQVTVLERGAYGRGCSHANCGLICPSHVLPLAAPGAVTAALRTLARANSPFFIKPRFDPGLWAWLYSFARRCNRNDLLAAGRAIQPLLNSSRLLYEELLAQEPIDCEWEARGVLFVFQTRPALEHYAATVQLQNQVFNIQTKYFAGNVLTELEPTLKPGLAGGWLYESDAHLRPDRLMSSWRRVLEERGVVVRENCEVTGFRQESGRAVAVQSAAGDFPAEAFVVAAGAWTSLWGRQLGGRIPIQPGKGYSLTMPRPTLCPKVPLLFEEHRVAVTPMRSGYRLGSTMEFAGYDTTLNRRRLDLLRKGARHYLHEPDVEPVLEEWFGWRPMTPDSVPIIGRSPALANVWIAAGHNMLGLSMAPATGKLVAELLAGDPCHLDPAPYAATRF